MSDAVRVTNLPDSGSPERVAYDLMTYISRNGHKRQNESVSIKDHVLDLYAECLRATQGGR